MNVFLISLGVFTFAVAPLSVAAQAPVRASAQLIGADGAGVGRVALTETAHTGVLLNIEVAGLTPGLHALHIHETGRCEAPSFASAGSHYAPRGHSHGLLHAHGSHAGDLTNLHVGADGRGTAEVMAPHVTLREGPSHSLFDGDGSAVVIHAGRDDHMSQPSGDGGSPIVCGVIRR